MTRASRPGVRVARRGAGFTLIELILATGMVAMLTLSLYVGMYTAFRARDVATAQTAPMRQAKIALDLIEQDLRSVAPPTDTTLSTATATDPSGTGTSAAGTSGTGASGTGASGTGASAAATPAGTVLDGPFLGTAAGQADQPIATIDCYTLGSDYGVDTPTSDGTRHVQLTLVSDTTGNTLTRYVTRNVLNSSPPDPEAQVLAENVVTFAVQYYDGTSWTPTWDSTQLQNALPLAVEVTIQVKAPTAADPNHLYKLVRTIMLPCGQTPDQAAANATAAATAAGTAAPTDGTTGTGTGTTGGAR